MGLVSTGKQDKEMEENNSLRLAIRFLSIIIASLLFSAIISLIITMTCYMTKLYLKFKAELQQMSW